MSEADIFSRWHELNTFQRGLLLVGAILFLVTLFIHPPRALMWSLIAVWAGLVHASFPRNALSRDAPKRRWSEFIFWSLAVSAILAALLWTDLWADLRRSEALPGMIGVVAVIVAVDLFKAWRQYRNDRDTAKH